MKGTIGRDARLINRRAVVSGAAAALVLGTGRARAAADFRYKFATNLPLTHPLNIRLQEAFDRIKKDSNGALEIELFANSQLGGDTDVLSQLRSGAVEFFTLSSVILSTLVPIASIGGIGFAMPDYDTVWRAMDGELGNRIRRDIAKANIVAMDRIWDNGFRHITTSSKPVHSPDDLHDIKMRVPVSPLWTSMFRAFGAAPVSINAAEIYSALSTKVADGEENPLTPIWSLKLYEVQRYLALTGHMWDGYWVLANQGAWQALPDDLRTMVAWHLNQAAIDQRADLAGLNTSLRTKLAANGMQFNDVDKDQFRARLRQAGFYTEWRDRYGAESWSLLEKYAGNLS
jgi:tripartite ATP-independent transporter DctP family solute receptor